MGVELGVTHIQLEVVDDATVVSVGQWRDVGVFSCGQKCKEHTTTHLHTEIKTYIDHAEIVPGRHKS